MLSIPSGEEEEELGDSPTAAGGMQQDWDLRSGTPCTHTSTSSVHVHVHVLYRPEKTTSISVKTPDYSPWFSARIRKN